MKEIGKTTDLSEIVTFWKGRILQAFRQIKDILVKFMLMLNSWEEQPQWGFIVNQGI